jgi:hypothetical protein
LKSLEKEKGILGNKGIISLINNILKGIKIVFESSLLFEKELAKKEEYPGIQWLFKHWKL